MAILVKGHSVSFDLPTLEIDARKEHGMMHDPTGRLWKKTSILVGPYWRSKEEADGDGHMRDYFGSSHLIRVGDAKLPPKGLERWRFIGDVEKIWYTRTGKKYGGKRFQHGFNKSLLGRIVKGKGRARLYQLGEWYRLELPRGAIVDGRGFLWP
jgi:hypothetical protein